MQPKPAEKGGPFFFSFFPSASAMPSQEGPLAEKSSKNHPTPYFFKSLRLLICNNYFVLHQPAYVTTYEFKASYLKLSFPGELYSETSIRFSSFQLRLTLLTFPLHSSLSLRGGLYLLPPFSSCGANRHLPALKLPLHRPPKRPLEELRLRAPPGL